jgi:hypothetical protein
MFCPQCGINQSEELKFCNKCGANLHAVRQAVTTRETEEKFDWNKTWVTEMFLTHSERRRRHEELELQRGITPEVKRYNEIKAGVITSCAGIGLMIFLYIFMQGIVLSGVDPKTAEILIRIWIVGVIPLLVGIGLIINGSVVSKKLLETMKENPRAKEIPTPLSVEGKTTEKPFLNPADTSKFIPSNFSVVDNTTELLKSPIKKAPAEGKSLD